jgi:hypothetical protein
VDALPSTANAGCAIPPPVEFSTNCGSIR